MDDQLTTMEDNVSNESNGISESKCSRERKQSRNPLEEDIAFTMLRQYVVQTTARRFAGVDRSISKVTVEHGKICFTQSTRLMSIHPHPVNPLLSIHHINWFLVGKAS